MADWLERIIILPREADGPRFLCNNRLSCFDKGCKQVLKEHAIFIQGE